jgi:hypothetical protein
MKKALLLIIFAAFASGTFAQTNQSGSTFTYSVSVQKTDSARTFVVNYANGEEFRKIMMLSWGQPDVFTAGNIVWNKLSLKNIGDNLKVTLSDGIETTQGSGIYYKLFADDNSKFNQLKDLQSDQKRKITLVFANPQGTNAVMSKTLENTVLSTLDHIISSFH